MNRWPSEWWSKINFKDMNRETRIFVAKVVSMWSDDVFGEKTTATENPAYVH
jgi:hypothetical protein